MVLELFFKLLQLNHSQQGQEIVSLASVLTRKRQTLQSKELDDRSQRAS